MNQLIENKYIIREATPADAQALAQMELICFPANEACPENIMLEAVSKCPSHYIVAALADTDEPVAMVNGISSNEEEFNDEFFKSKEARSEDGKNFFICGVETLPEHRSHRLANILMEELKQREKQRGRKALILTCHDYLVPFYAKMGFKDLGPSKSQWGGVAWKEMRFDMDTK